jgi:hypothetical protein
MTVKITKGKPYPSFEAICEEWNLPRPEREHQFALPRKWAFDFAWLDYKIALEIEGGAFKGPGHRSVGKFLRDIEKYNEAAINNWRVLRCTTDDIKSGKVFALLARVLL